MSRFLVIRRFMSHGHGKHNVAINAISANAISAAAASESSFQQSLREMEQRLTSKIDKQQQVLNGLEENMKLHRIESLRWHGESDAESKRREKNGIVANALISGICIAGSLGVGLLLFAK